MSGPARLTSRRARMRRLGRSQPIALATVLVVVASMAGIAVAASTTLGTGKVTFGGTSKTVVVDSRGATLYTLSGETARHLKCVSSSCFGAWPPYTVSASAKLTRSTGVRGTLSKLHRVSAGIYQVMLNGHPLYRFAPDMGKKGSAMGDGVVAFGGTWHVVAAS
jgi:predicted lipoprotein with Yx(FWY)xxD motif